MSMTTLLSPEDESRVLSLFGKPSFRPVQRELIACALRGESCLGVLPTGHGKSLCYQAAAVLFGGTSVVVSPLIALMRDQEDSLRALGIAARRWESGLSPAERAETLEALRAGELAILFVAPESLDNAELADALRDVPKGLFVVDEVHCVSEWGHSFRPDYLKLPAWAEPHGFHAVMALTATATLRVQEDLCRAFGMAAGHVFALSPYRPGIDRRVCSVSEEGRDRLLEGFLREPEHLPAIVYCRTRKSTEEVADRLGKAGFSARAYHAGQPTDVRARIQDDFLSGSCDVLVATIAFGMGIDKQDVRTVVHYHLPANPESYIQESGRAGRDGGPSWSLVLLSPGDLVTARNRIRGEVPDDEGLMRCVRWLLPAARRVVSLWELGTECDLPEEVIQRILQRMQDEGIVEVAARGAKYYKARPLFPIGTILDGRSEEERKVLLWLDGRREGEVEDLAFEFDMDWTEARACLDEMEQSGEWKIAFRQSALQVRTLDPAASPRDVADLLADYYAGRCRAAQERLDTVLGMFTGHDCLNRALGAYFGFPGEEPCGHCFLCRGERMACPEAVESAFPDDLREQLDELADRGLSALSRPSQWVRFLLGISSPASLRARLWAHPLYGACSGCGWDDVARFCGRS